jgi:hypothetical protein
MKVGDLVRPVLMEQPYEEAIGVIIDSRTMVKISGLSTELAHRRGQDLNSHHVYWSDPKVKKNPAWVKERDLVRAV